MSDERPDDDDSLFSSRFYFDLKGAFNEARGEFGGSDNKAKALASAKLAAKALANTGVFATKLGVEILKRAPAAIAKQAEGQLKDSPHLSDERREKLQDIAGRAQESHEKMQDLARKSAAFHAPRPPATERPKSAEDDKS